MITVLGATGKTGRHVAEQAAGRGRQVRAAGRGPAAHGTHVPFDYDDETTWHQALEGSDAACVVIPSNHPSAPAVIEAAVNEGAGRIVPLSTTDVSRTPSRTT